MVAGSSTYCPRGYTCTGGVKTLCAAGSYCNDYGKTVPSGLCFAGYYCNAGSMTQTPTSLATDKGAMCTQAHYCAAGTVTPVACPSGSYSNGVGLQDVTDCNPCPDGFYCSGTGTYDALLTACPAGFYCPSGTASSASAIPCPIGHYCPLGSTNPTPCAPGYYTDIP
jgi:hypothetical protein